MIKLLTLIRPFARYFLIVWVLAMMFFSSIPNIPTLKIHTARSDIRLDYLIHFLEYFSLTGLSYLTFAGEKFILDIIKILRITIILVLFAIMDEYHQKLIPGRSFSYKDILSNLTGIISGVVFCVAIFRMIRTGHHYKIQTDNQD